VPHNGTLYEATLAVASFGNWVNPKIEGFLARAESGDSDPVLLNAPGSIGSGQIGPGGNSTGKLYFDVIGDVPNSVAWNDGTRDILAWVPGTIPLQGTPVPPVGPVGTSEIIDAPAESDDAGAHDHQYLLVFRVSQIDRMNRGGQRLVGRGFFEADVIRNRNHAAGDLRCDPQELRIAAHADRGVAPADRHRRHLAANFHDLAAEFVAKDSALLDRQPELKKQAFTIGVQIRSANAAGSDSHQRLAVIQFGPGNVLESNIAWTVKYRGFHDGLSFSLARGSVRAG
jgi:hypothetical protein